MAQIAYVVTWIAVQIGLQIQGSLPSLAVNYSGELVNSDTLESLSSFAR